MTVQIGAFLPDRDQPPLSTGEDEVIRRFHDLYYRRWQAGADTITLSWFGYLVLKCPLDLWIYQELLVRCRPDVVIECGTHEGGSALFLAMVLDQIGLGQVITIDIENRPGMPPHPRITYLTGSSTDPLIVEQVRRRVRDRTVMAILDSDHREPHVLDELRIYSEFVSPGGYLIVEDTNINGHPTFPEFGPGPMEAVEKFLAHTDDFVVDERCERFLMTCNPRGYLKRKEQSSRPVQTSLQAFPDQANDPGEDTSATATPRVPVSIVIPAFGAAAQLAECLESLSRHAPSGCEVLVADDATPDDSVSEVAKSFRSRLRLTYVRRPDNLGFVENCNDAIRAVLPGGNDVLLLNSDTRVTAGFLEEMWEVLHLHEKHAAVSPRSNNASAFSVPISRALTPEDAYRLWLSIRFLLPRYQVMPTAVGFCLLIKNSVLSQFGVFDPVYSPGYNEENDFICRIARHGYSAVAADRAFVFHHQSSSFGLRQRVLERRNRRVLDERYPEYSRNVARHLRSGVDPIDHFSILWRAHRKSILFDLFHLHGRRSPASGFALGLLLHLAPLLEPDCNMSLGLSEEARRFFAGELSGFRFYDVSRDADARFDLVFKPSQIFTWPEFQRMVRMGGRIAYCHLDMADTADMADGAARYADLSSPGTRALFKKAAQLSDRVMTISELSRGHLAAAYGLAVPFDVVPLDTPGDRSVMDPPVAAPGENPIRDWGRVASQFARSLKELLDRELNVDLIRRRFELLATIDGNRVAAGRRDAATDKPRPHARSLHAFESALEELRRP